MTFEGPGAKHREMRQILTGASARLCHCSKATGCSSASEISFMVALSTLQGLTSFSPRQGPGGKVSQVAEPPEMRIPFGRNLLRTRLPLG